MILGALNQAGFLRLLKALQGNGYSADDTGPNVAELSGIAKVGEMASEAVDAATRNAFVSHAVEALDTHDQLRALPSDANLTTAQRQSRLVAFTRVLPKLIEARLDAALDAWIGTTTGVTLSPTATLCTDHGCSPHGALSVTRREPSASLDQLRVIDAMFTRGLPARSMGNKAATATSNYGAGLDRTALTTAAVSTIDPGGPVVAPFEQYPGSVVTTDEWREIQAMNLWKPYRGGTGTTSNHFTVSHDAAGEMIYASGSIAAGAVVTLDRDLFYGGWGNRVVQAWCAAHSASFTDSIVASHGWLSACKLNYDGVGGYQHLFQGTGVVTGLKLRATSGQQLELENTSGATIHFRMFVRGTASVSPSTTYDREPWVSTEVFSAVCAASMHAGARIRNANDSASAGTYANLVNEGTAVRRILYTGPMQRANLTASDTPSVVVLDSSIDWRGRALLVTYLVGGSTVVQHAGSDRIAGNSTSGSTMPHSRVVLTGTGATSTPASAPAFQAPLAIGSPINIYIYADSTTGALMAETKNASTDAYSHAFIMVTASPTLGTPSGTPMQAIPVDGGSLVYPADLNRPQNMGCYAQGQSNGTTALTSPPLGTVVDGAMPSRPVSWLVRERLGELADRTIEVRQKIYGQRKRLLSIGVAAGATINADAFSAFPVATDSNLDQMDYRDRLLMIEGAYSSTDITLGRATSLNDDGSTKFAWNVYTGPFGDHSVTVGDITLTVQFRRTGADCFQSRLLITNGAGAARYVNIAVEATGFLGLTDRRLAGQVA